MDAVTQINKHIDVVKLLEHYEFDHIRQEGNMIRSSCKLHGGNNPTAFVINEEGLWYCHTGGCGGGDIYTLVQKMEECDFTSAVHWLSNFFGVDISNLHIMERKIDYLEDIKKFIKMMKGRKKKQASPFTINEELRDVVQYRNFKEETIKHFDLHYVEKVTLKKRDSEETYTLFHRLVFPIIFNNIQIGLSFRRTKTKDFPKWSHQPANLETGDVLYNYDSAKTESVIVVTEGISDVWAWYEIGIQAVATFGAHMTDMQYKLLLKTGADIVLAYDGDDAGRSATKKATALLKNKANISVVNFNEGEDPESIEREELKKRYDTRRKI